MSRGGSSESHYYSRLGGGRGAGGSRADEDAMQHHGSRGEDLEGRWFSLENSPMEIRSLTRLEREMNSSLMFEHGGGKSASRLWVVCILLGHFFEERLALGRVVEVFAKYQRQEAMRCMVKLQDLVDLAEPPLGGTSGAPTLDHSKDEAMDLDGADEYQGGAIVIAQCSPGEVNFDLV